MWCQQVSWCLFCYYAEKLPLKRMRGCTFLPSLLKSKSGFFTKLKRFSHVGEVTKIADGLRLKKSPVHQILGICPRNFWAEPLLNIYLSIRGFLHKKFPDFESTDKTPPRRVPLHQESSLSERFFRVFSCFWVLVTGSGPRWKKRETAKKKK